MRQEEIEYRNGGEGKVREERQWRRWRWDRNEGGKCGEKEGKREPERGIK